MNSSHERTQTMGANYQQIAKDARLKVLDLIYRAQVSHIGSNFSCIDILTVLFEKIDLDNDKFVLSKGWVAASLYYFLWRKGRITEEELDSFCKEGSKFIGLAEPITPDIMIAGGSMSMGLSGGVGLALAKKLKNESGKVFVLESDGGLNGGMVWESLAIAKQNHLDNLVLILDINCLQAMGKTKDILDMEPIEDKLKSFGWDWDRIDGHNYLVIEEKLNRKPRKGIPYSIICDTIKGYPISFMRGDNIFHYKQLSESEFSKALTELNHD